MDNDRQIRPFSTTQEWYEDWPHDVLTTVQVLASVTGAAADRAVDSFLGSLTPDSDAAVADDTSVHYWGGYTAVTSRSSDGDGWQIVLASAGEDGFDSVIGATEDLFDAVCATRGDVRLTWQALPASRTDEL